jgi:hypothetical protein
MGLTGLIGFRVSFKVGKGGFNSFSLFNLLL